MNDTWLLWSIEEDNFSSIDIWGSLLDYLCTTSNWKTTLKEWILQKIIDDHVIYIIFFGYIC
jgi:hypothetical protein